MIWVRPFPCWPSCCRSPLANDTPHSNLTPQKRKEKTLKALLAQVEGLAAQHPVLMVFEDVHWIDPTTRESLDLIIDRVSALRVLVIVTFRPEFTPPWIGRPQVTLLTLNRLPPRQRADMIPGSSAVRLCPRRSPTRSSSALTAFPCSLRN